MTNDNQNHQPENLSQSSAGGTAASVPAKKRRPKIGLFFLIVIAALVLLVLLAPTLVSTRPGVNMIQRVAKSRTGRTITLGDVSLGWLGPCSVTNLLVEDEKGRKVAQVGRINLSAGLLTMIKARGQSGRVEVDSGEVYVYMPAPGEEAEDKNKEKKEKSKTPAQQVPIGTLAPLNWDITVRNTTVHLQRQDGAAYEIKNIAGDVSLKAFDSCRAVLNLELPGNAPLAVDAKVNYVVTDGKLDLEHTQGSVTLKTASPIDLESATKFFSAGPPILGQVAVDLQANFTSDQIQSRLACQLKNIQNIQSGGVAIRPIDVRIAAETTVTAPRIVSQLDIDGGCGQLKVRFDWRDRDQPIPAMTAQEYLDAILAGKTIVLPKCTIESSGRLDLAAVARAVPSAMKLRPGLEILSGDLIVNNIRVEGGQAPEMVGGVELKNLVSNSSTGQMSYQPIQVDFYISTKAQQGLWIRQLKFRSNFAQADAAGSMSALQLDFTADLDPLRRQLNELFQLGQLELAGRVEGNMNVNRPDSQKMDLTASIKAQSMRYASAGKRWLCQAANLDFKGVLDLADDKLVRVTAQSARVNVDNEVIFAGAGWYDIRQNTFQARLAVDEFHLAALGRWAAGFGAKMPKELAGTLMGSLDVDRPDLKRINLAASLKADHLKYADADKQWLCQAADLEYKGILDLAEDKLTRITVNTASANIDNGIRMAGTGWYDTQQNTFQGKLTLDEIRLDALSLLAAAFGAKMPDGLIGTVKGQADLSHDKPENPILSSGQASVLGLSVAGRAIGDARKSILFDWSQIQFQPQKQEFKLASLKLDSPFARMNAQNIVASWPKPPVQKQPAGEFAVAGHADVSADLKQLTDLLRAWPQLASVPPMQGMFSWVGDAKTAGRIAAINGSGAMKDFRVGNPPAGFEEKQIDFTHDLRIDQAQEKIEVSKLSINSASGILMTEMTGTISQYSGPCVMDLTGKYVAGWDRIMALLKQFKPDIVETFALVGSSKSDFKISGPLRPAVPQASAAADAGSNKGQAASPLRGLIASVGVGWDKAKVYGTDLGKADFPVSLGGAKLQIPQTTIPADPGAARIGFQLDMNTAEPVLMIDKKLQLLEKYKVTPDMARQLLSRINPIFNEMAQVDGEISLWVESVNMPLGESMKKSGSGRGRLDLAKMNVQPTGILKQLLELGGVYDQKTAPMVVNGCDFHVENGRIYYENFTVQFGDKFDLNFYGSVGFDGSVDLTVSVPVRQAMLEKFGAGGNAGEYAKLLDGVRIEIPIKGTRDKTTMDMAKVSLEPLIRKATEAMMKNKADQVLNQLFSPNQSGQTQQNSSGQSTGQKTQDKALDLLDQIIKQPPQQQQQQQQQSQQQQHNRQRSNPNSSNP